MYKFGVIGGGATGIFAYNFIKISRLIIAKDRYL